MKNKRSAIPETRLEPEEIANVIGFLADAVSAIVQDVGFDRQSAAGVSLTLNWVKDQVEAQANGSQIGVAA